MTENEWDGEMDEEAVGIQYSSLGMMRAELRQRGGKNGQGKSGMKLIAVSEVEWIGLGIRLDAKRCRRRLCHF